MSEEEITALAREYAAETVSHTRLSTTIADEAEDVIRFLLRRFCLVEKGKVEDVYQRAKNTEKDGEDLKLSLLCRTGRVQRILLESLFPEIAKEVENG